MISNKLLRISSGPSGVQLGLTSYFSAEHKKSIDTLPFTSEYQDTHHGQTCSYKKQYLQLSPKYQINSQQLRLKLLKLSDYKANMQQKFKKQIILMKNQLLVMNTQGQILDQVVRQLRKDVEVTKIDLAIIKRCVENKQMRLSVSPDFTKNIKQKKLLERHTIKSKPSKLFKPNMHKIK